ncbi:hypothetical protein PIB30_077409, partial [Stylosanthes scabra]|nr:hypothetical protein [Stylosanthes scabra]
TEANPFFLASENRLQTFRVDSLELEFILQRFHAYAWMESHQATLHPRIGVGSHTMRGWSHLRPRIGVGSATHRRGEPRLGVGSHTRPRLCVGVCRIDSERSRVDSSFQKLISEAMRVDSWGTRVDSHVFKTMKIKLQTLQSRL